MSGNPPQFPSSVTEGCILDRIAFMLTCAITMAAYIHVIIEGEFEKPFDKGEGW